MLTATMLLALVLPVLPTVTLASEYTDEFDKFLNPQNDMLDSNNNPVKYLVQDPSETPYGTKAGEAFRLREDTELNLLNTFSNARNWNTTYDTYDEKATGAGKTDNYERDEHTLHIGESKSDKGSFKSAKGYSVPLNSGKWFGTVPSFAESVAFDATGCGRRNCIAYIGLRSDDYVVVWFEDWNGNIVDWYRVGLAKWMRESKLLQHEAGNFLAIAAGHFSDEPGDQVVYAALDHDESRRDEGDYKNAIQTRLKQYRFSADGSSFTVEQIDSKSGTEVSHSMLHSYYCGGGVGFNMDRNGGRDYGGSVNNGKENKLGGDLAVGDFNNDGYDDLACVTYTGRLDANDSWDSDKINYKYAVPQLKVCFGGANKANMFTSANNTYVTNGPYLDYDADETEDDAEDRLCQSLVAASVTAGDLNADGVDEIIVTGFENMIELPVDTDVAEGRRYLWDVDNDRLGIYVYNASSSGISTYARSYLECNDWTEYGTFSTDDVWSPPCAAVVGFFGIGAQKRLFVNGSVYRVQKASSGNTGTVTHAYTAQYFDHFDMGMSNGTSYNITNVFMQSAAVGNFTENTDGYESVYYTVGLKASGTAYYTYFAGMIGGTDYEKDEVGASDFDYFSKQTDYLIWHEGGDVNESLNCVVTAVDRDSDGVVAKYRATYVQHTDPEVLAVLQASPHFSELGDYQAAGETSYSITAGYEYGESWSKDHTFSFGLGIEGDTGRGVKVDFSAGPRWEWEESWEKSLSQSKELSFSTGNEDVVILSRIPVYTYYFDVQGADGSWQECGMFVSALRSPSYVSWSVDEYNAFVDYYDGVLASAGITGKNLTKLTNGMLGTGGDPTKYAHNQNGFTSLSNTVMPLGYDSDTISSSYSIESSSTYSSSVSHGYSVELSVKFGGEIAADAELWVGLYAEHTGNYTKGTYTTTINGSATSGSVSNIDGQSMRAAGIEEATYKQYYFDWDFGQWQLDLGASGDVPLAGYVLTNVTGVRPGPDDLTATCDLTTCTLTWSDVDEAVGYNAYSVKDGVYTKLNTSPISSGSGGWTCPLDDDGESIHTFAVNAIFGSGSKRFNSLYSNEAVTVSLNVKALEEWLTENGIEDGQDGRGIRSITLVSSDGPVDTYRITYTDDETVTFTVTNGVDGEDGDDGVDGREIELRYNEDAKTVEWHYVGDSDWTTLMAVTESELVRGAQVVLRRDGTGSEEKIQWKYDDEADTAWRDLISLSALKGDSGEDGDDGRTVELRVNDVDGRIEWRYEDEQDWTELISLEELKGDSGADGREVQLRYDDETGALQWKYDAEPDTAWRDLAVVPDLKGDPGDDGREVELDADETSGYVRWRYEGDSAWTNLIALDALRGASGEDGREIEMRVDEVGGNVEWRYEDEQNWKQLISLESLRGSDGADGREVEMRYDADTKYVQWRYEGDSDWTNLCLITEFGKGDPGEPGADGKEIELQADADSGQIQWRYLGEQTWKDLIAIEDLRGEDGSDGANGRDVELRVDSGSGLIEWRCKGDENWTPLMSLAELKGDKGDAGLGIVSILPTAITDEATTYTITYTDRTTYEFTVRNGAPGRDGREGAPGADGRDGADGADGAPGADGADGADGAPGADGADGADGAPGADGADGADGAPGRDGVDGEDGSVVIQRGADGRNGAPGADGADGVGIRSAAINENGHLVLTYTDGRTQDVGRVVAEAGADGADGRDGADGTDGANGARGNDGADGRPGSDGVSLSGAAIDGNGHLVLTYSDGRTEDLGQVADADNFNSFGETITRNSTVNTYFFSVPYDEVQYLEADGKTVTNYSTQRLNGGTLVTVVDSELPSHAKKLTVVGASTSQSISLKNTAARDPAPWWIIFVLLAWNTVLTACVAALFLRGRGRRGER